MRSIFFLCAIQGFAAFNLTWGTPAVNLDSNPPVGDTDSNAALSIDQNGNAIATWSRTTGRFASEDIWAAAYNHSLRVWTGAVKISGGGSASNAQVATDPEGNAVILWEEGFPTQIKYRTLSYDGVWSPDLSAPPNSVASSINAQTAPQIAFDYKGNALAIWMEFFGGKEHICSAFYNMDSGWMGAGEITSGMQDAHLTPQKSLAVSKSSGIGIATWEEITNAVTTSVWASRFIDGDWTDPLEISNELGKKATFPAAGIDHWGNAVIVWSQDDAIQSKTIKNNQLSEKALTISHPGYKAIRPAVGVDGKGNAIVVYERYDTMHKFISGAHLPRGASSWNHPVDISAPSPADAAAAGYPVLSVNEIGDAVVIWKEFTGSNMVIQGAGYSIGTWSNTKTLSSLSDDSGAKTPAYDISVVLNDAGNILAIWPEDPTGLGTLQIKSTAGVGLANAAPMPPLVAPETVQLGGVVSGKQIIHRFPAHADLINIITWTAPSGVNRFNIYRNNLSSLVTTIEGNYYEDHCRAPKEQVMYLITSVDGNGQESSPMTIVVPPL